MSSYVDLNFNAGVSYGARCQKFDLMLHLLPNIMYAINEGSDETVCMDIIA